MSRRAAGFAEAQARAAGKLLEASTAAAAAAVAEALRGIVQMRHIDRVVQETTNQAHMRLIGSAPRLEKALLACLLMETRATGEASCSLPLTDLPISKHQQAAHSFITGIIKSHMGLICSAPHPEKSLLARLLTGNAT